MTVLPNPGLEKSITETAIRPTAPLSIALITSGSRKAAAVPPRSMRSSPLLMLPETSVASTSFKSTYSTAAAGQDQLRSATSVPPDTVAAFKPRRGANAFTGRSLSVSLRRCSSQLCAGCERAFPLHGKDPLYPCGPDDEGMRLSCTARLQFRALLQRFVEIRVVAELHVGASGFCDLRKLRHRIGVGGVVRFDRLEIEAVAAPKLGD